MIDPAEAKIIENARDRIEREWFLAIYMCRDLDIVKEARLDDLAWVLVKYEASREDVKWFFELLDEYLKE